MNIIIIIVITLVHCGSTAKQMELSEKRGRARGARLMKELGKPVRKES